MAWYGYLIDALCGLLLVNGVPHFVMGVSGNRFQSPFGSPPGIGESSPLSNALWGYLNLAIGFALLWFFRPKADGALAGWIAFGLGALLAAVWLSKHFGKVRGQAH